MPVVVCFVPEILSLFFFSTYTQYSVDICLVKVLLFFVEFLFCSYPRGAPDPKSIFYFLKFFFSTYTQYSVDICLVKVQFIFIEFLFCSYPRGAPVGAKIRTSLLPFLSHLIAASLISLMVSVDVKHHV